MSIMWDTCLLDVVLHYVRGCQRVHTIIFCKHRCNLYSQPYYTFSEEDTGTHVYVIFSHNVWGCQKVHTIKYFVNIGVIYTVNLIIPSVKYTRAHMYI